MASDMRIATNKRGGTIANPGSVAFNFDKKGLIIISKDKINEDDLFIAATEAGAEDFEVDEENYMVITDPSNLYTVKEVLEEMSIPTIEASLVMIPKTYVEVDEENEKANLALVEWLEELDDVDNVFHNMQSSN
jgi:transcriptional/translational regulatory protein YebC/TACO1